MLVLFMMLVVPLLSAEQHMIAAESGLYGADEVWANLEDVVSANCPSPRNDSAGAECRLIRRAYERSILRFLYFHNWFTARHGCPDRACSAAYLSHVFMVGLQGGDAVALEKACDFPYARHNRRL